MHGVTMKFTVNMLGTNKVVIEPNKKVLLIEQITLFYNELDFWLYVKPLRSYI